jgi:ribosomal protein S18 acetylase RimI-like enzyme
MLDNYRFRSPDLPADFCRMAALLNVSNDGDGIQSHTSVDDVSSNYRHLEHCDPATDMIMAERDGVLAGYTRTEWWQEANGPRVHAVFAFVHPDDRESGLLQALFDWSETRNREIAQADLATEIAYQGWVQEQHQQWLAEEYDARGYDIVTYGAEMVRPDLSGIPDTKLPAGVEIRPVEASHLRPIWEADVEAFRDHWGYAEPTEADYRRFLDFPHRDESLWQIAWHDDEVVGQVRSFIDDEENAKYDRKRGYTEFISTARAWRRKGVARALICASLERLAERGMTEAALGVHTENPNGAYDLYQSLGFEVEQSYRTYRKPVDLAG